MAHNLCIIDGKASFASAIEVPWHNLGQILDHVMTSEEAMCNAQLCFDVEKKPLFREVSIVNNEGEIVPIMEKMDTHMETRRMDTGTTLGIVGSGYEIVQNKDCFTFFDNIVGSGEAIYETAGALGKGEMVFITAKLPKDIVIGPSDLINNYIVLCTSHNGSLALTSFFTPVRVVCNNTLNAALQNCQNRVYLKHTSNVKENMFEAAKIMGLSSKYMTRFEEVMNYLYDKEITEKDIKSVLQSTFLDKGQLKQLAETNDVEISTRKENVIIDVMNFYENHPTMDNIKGSAYGLYNCITGYYNYIKEYSNPEQKFKNIVLQGTDWNYSQRCFKAL